MHTSGATFAANDEIIFKLDVMKELNKYNFKYLQTPNSNPTIGLRRLFDFVNTVFSHQINFVKWQILKSFDIDLAN